MCSSDLYKGSQIHQRIRNSKSGRRSHRRRYMYKYEAGGHLNPYMLTCSVCQVGKLLSNGRIRVLSEQVHVKTLRVPNGDSLNRTSPSQSDKLSSPSLSRRRIVIVGKSMARPPNLQGVLYNTCLSISIASVSWLLFFWENCTWGSLVQAATKCFAKLSLSAWILLCKYAELLQHRVEVLLTHQQSILLSHSL